MVHELSPLHHHVGVGVALCDVAGRIGGTHARTDHAGGGQGGHIAGLWTVGGHSTRQVLTRLTSIGSRHEPLVGGVVGSKQGVGQVVAGSVKTSVFAVFAAHFGGWARGYPSKD